MAKGTRRVAMLVSTFLILLTTLATCKPTAPAPNPENHLPHTVPEAALNPKVKTICYTHLGCFSLNGTFKNMLPLPASPESINTKFTLFTNHNKNVGHAISYNDLGSLSITFLNTSLPTIFLVHGFAIEYEPTTHPFKNALLEYHACNLVVVDWRLGAKAPEIWQAVPNSELVGRQITKLISTLVETRTLNPQEVYIIGTSLGAHVAGFAGKWAISSFGFRIERITALDPAGLYFEDLEDTAHVSRKDANYVDIIHTNGGRDLLGGELGMEKAVGHVDFYPNGGKLQAGCIKGDLSCSHNRAVFLFLETLTKTPSCYFKSFPCPGGYGDFQKGLCRDCGTEGCGRLGIGSRKVQGRGIQYLDTNGQTPFCKQ